MEFLSQSYLSVFDAIGPWGLGFSMITPLLALAWQVVRRRLDRWIVVALLLAFMVGGYIVPLTMHYVNNQNLKSLSQKDYDDRCFGSPATADFWDLCYTTRGKLNGNPLFVAHWTLYLWYGAMIREALGNIVWQIGGMGTIIALVAAFLSRQAISRMQDTAFKAFHGSSAAAAKVA
jgi:hypothetical protein